MNKKHLTVHLHVWLDHWCVKVEANRRRQRGLLKTLFCLCCILWKCCCNHALHRDELQVGSSQALDAWLKQPPDAPPQHIGSKDLRGIPGRSATRHSATRRSATMDIQLLRLSATKDFQLPRPSSTRLSCFSLLYGTPAPSAESQHPEAWPASTYGHLREG